MNTLRPSTEDEMILTFLRQEYASIARYAAKFEAAFASANLSSALITDPHPDSSTENADRRRLFAHYRGYGIPGDSYFTDFPVGQLAWQWFELTREELLMTKFVNYWAGIWESTRDPRNLAHRIRTGSIPHWAAQQQADTRLIALADQSAAGTALPPLILVSANDGQTRVVMEGNSRLTA